MIELNGKIQVIGEDCILTEGMVVDKSENFVDFSIPADDRHFKLFREGEQVQAQVFQQKQRAAFQRIYKQTAVKGNPHLQDFKPVWI